MINVPVRHTDSALHRRLISDTVNQLIPVVKSVTLTLTSTTTTVTDEAMGKDKTVLLIPTNSSAASENWSLTAKNNGSFVLTHTSAGTTRTFDYIIIG